LFHTFQAALIGKPRLLTTDGAPWVIEGSAEFAAYSYLVNSGLTTWAAVHKDTDPFLSRRLAPAAGTASGTGEFYPVAFLAVEKLVGSGGLHLLGQFFVDSGQMDWRDAFKKDFGQEAIAYINAFEAARPPRFAPIGPRSSVGGSQTCPRGRQRRQRRLIATPTMIRDKERVRML
jgi:hypothetical protein